VKIAKSTISKNMNLTKNVTPPLEHVINVMMIMMMMAI